MRVGVEEVKVFQPATTVGADSALKEELAGGR